MYDLHVIMEGIAIELAEIARLAHAEDDGFKEAVEASEHLLRRHVGEIPWSDRLLDGL